MSGANVTAAEKASYVTLAGANTFTSANIVHVDGTTVFQVEKADGTDVFLVDTTNKEIEARNGSKIRGFSDASTTETFSIDAATGTAQFDNTVEATGGRFIGEQLWWEIEIDGGGVAITTGTKRRIKIPYNCTIISDGTSVWDLTLDQTGSIGLDLWVDTYTNYPPTNADRISGTIGSNNPRITTATKAQSASLTNWTTTLTKGSYLFVDVNSITTATFCTLGLHVKKT
jgi:hypothetical protein